MRLDKGAVLAREKQSCFAVLAADHDGGLGLEVDGLIRIAFASKSGRGWSDRGEPRVRLRKAENGISLIKNFLITHKGQPI